jgi:RecA-family ATPase
MLIGGDSKIGKSFICIEFLRALTTGGNLFHDSYFSVPNPCRTLYCEQEVGKISLYDRFIQSYSQSLPTEYAENAFFSSQQPELKLDDDNSLVELSEFIEANGINVCILDPLAKFHGKDENSNQEMGEVFDRLSRVISAHADTGLSFIISHHFKKPPYDRNSYDPLDPNNFRGAGRLFADPDSMMMGQRTSTQRKTINGIPNCEVWNVNLRWILRHGKSPDDMTIQVSPESEKPVKLLRRGKIII